MFSLLDAMIGRPLAEMLDELGLPDDIRNVLLDGDSAQGGPADVHRIVLASERSDWAAGAGAATRLGIPTDRILELFVESAAWCSDIFHAQRQEDAVVR
jgi:c-di-GMP-related signal transduction protein